MLKKPDGEGTDAPAKETRSGTISGEIKSKKEQNNNIVIEVLAPGEEKARSYFVQYDPKIKGPIPEILKAVRAAKVGDKVVFDWEATGHGPAIVKFEVLKKPKRRQEVTAVGYAEMLQPENLAMHRALAGLALLLLPGVADAQPRKLDPTKYGWHTDYAAAKAEAKRTGKPIFLVFRCEP